MWTHWVTADAEDAFRREPGETIAKALAELDALHQVDPLEWSKAALVVAMAAARAGTVTVQTLDLVLRVKAMFGPRYDVLSVQDFLATRSGMIERVEDHVLVAAATTWDQVVYVASRWLEKTRGLDAQAARTLAKTTIDSPRAPPILGMTADQRMRWLHHRRLFLKD